MNVYIMIIVLLMIVITVLAVKLYVLRLSLREISDGLCEILSKDTNTLISISSSDSYARQLAVNINKELRALRKERLRLQYGDAELKNAITNIAHDLRTPLTAISGYLELMKVEAKSEALNRYLDILFERTESMKNLTEELFRYSVITSSTDDFILEDVSLNRELEIAVIGFYGALTENGITPDIQMSDMNIIRKLDRATLQRIFSNILSNAVKYSQGDLSIELRDTGDIIFTNSTKNMSKVEAAKLFDRFYTVQTVKGSTGLGLSIAKHLTAKLGGTIGATYEEGKLIICLSFH